MADTGRPGDRYAAVAALSLGIVVALLVLVVASPEPLAAIRAFLITPLTNRYYLGNMLNEAGHLLIAGLGVVVAFRSGLYNLGGEGQIYVAGFVVTMVGLALPPGPGVWAFPLLLLVGAGVGGGADCFYFD